MSGEWRQCHMCLVILGRCVKERMQVSSLICACDCVDVRITEKSATSSRDVLKEEKVSASG